MLYRAHFQLPAPIAAQLTHLSYDPLIEWTEFGSGRALHSLPTADRPQLTRLYRHFPSLRVLRVCSVLPLKEVCQSHLETKSINSNLSAFVPQLLTRFALHKLPHLETLQAASYSNGFIIHYNGNKVYNTRNPMPVEWLPRIEDEEEAEDRSAIQYSTVRTLELKPTVHQPQPWLERMFPVLDKLKLFATGSPKESNSVCDHCRGVDVQGDAGAVPGTGAVPPHSHLVCQATFVRSVFTDWKRLPKVYFNGIRIEKEMLLARDQVANHEWLAIPPPIQRIAQTKELSTEEAQIFYKHMII